jgi:hypothetical protein
MRQDAHSRKGRAVILGLLQLHDQISDQPQLGGPISEMGGGGTVGLDLVGN